jgi:PD-(D/E)XK nuclease superfamily
MVIVLRIEETTTVFDQLLGLYQREGLSVPTEDFTTEVLAGVLKSKQYLLDDFVNQVLKQPGVNWKVMTQVFYPLEDNINCIVDMVLYNDDSIAFIENKVDSHLHTDQLGRYEEVLLRLKKESSFEKVSLHYCTKRLEKMDARFEVEFQYFRWKDIYQFLGKYEEDSLVKGFLTFLERKRLMKSVELETSDLDLMKAVPNLFLKLEGMIEPIRVEMEKRFGPVKAREGKQQVSQLVRHNRYSIGIAPAFGEGLSDITAGFTFDHDPSLTVQVWCNRKNKQSERFHRIITKNEKLFDAILIKEKGWGIRFQIPLGEILNHDNQYSEVMNWVIAQLDNLESFILDTEELGWNIPIKRSIIATRGESSYLVQLGSSRGQILDTFSKVTHPPQNFDSILKMGYWDEHDLTTEEEADILSIPMRKEKAFLK